MTVARMRSALYELRAVPRRLPDPVVSEPALPVV
jgi:hypothetical protein